MIEHRQVVRVYVSYICIHLELYSSVLVVKFDLYAYLLVLINTDCVRYFSQVYVTHRQLLATYSFGVPVSRYRVCTCFVLLIVYLASILCSCIVMSLSNDLSLPLHSCC